MPKPIVVIVGAQYGSEAKGTVAGQLCIDRNVDVAVRTGAINAGHTVCYGGQRFAMQQIPVAWVNPHAKLVIGAGAYVHEETLKREIEMINAATGQDVLSRLVIDHRAAVHTDTHHASEKSKGLHARMGSTGEGVAAAIVDKMDRRFDYELFEAVAKYPYQFADTTALLHEAYAAGQQIILEGTQGTMLDFHFGYYPYVTSRQTIAAGWVAEAGLSPAYNYEVIVVARTFPIRVAGNSGPLSREISWPTLARRINAKRKKFMDLPPLVDESAIAAFEERVTEEMVRRRMPAKPLEHYTPDERKLHAADISEIHQTVLNSLPAEIVTELRKLFEVTTVTKKLRRIADMDLDELAYACRLNGATSIALTFLNYLFPGVEVCTSWTDIEKTPYYADVQDTLMAINEATGVPVRYVNVSPLGIIEVPDDFASNR